MFQPLIIMLLDLKVEEKNKFRRGTIVAALVIPGCFILILCGVLQNSPNEEYAALNLAEGAKHYDEGSTIHTELSDPESPSLPDVHLIGHQIFKGYNFLLQIVGILLLVASVGVVALSRKAEKSPAKS